MTSGYKTGTKKHKIKAKLAIATLQAMIQILIGLTLPRGKAHQNNSNYAPQPMCEFQVSLPLLSWLILIQCEGTRT